jgi:transcriptional regulator with XRE-family HTH domain
MSKPDILKQVMQETRTSQVELSRLSGVRQPSLSQFLSGRVQMSDEMLNRLLTCMGHELEISRRPVRVEMDRDSRRRWLMHRQLLQHLTPETWQTWRDTMLHNIERLRESTHGQPHERNIDRWCSIVETDDVPSLRRIMLDTSTDGIEMREVSPLLGLLPEDERLRVLEELAR